MAVGPIEPAFWRELLGRLGLAPDTVPDRGGRDAWPALARLLADTFLTRTQAQWTAVFDGSDACVTPVVSLREAVDHPQIAARGSLRLVGGRNRARPGPAVLRIAAALARTAGW